jgi:hypothetical protein
MRIIEVTGGPDVIKRLKNVDKKMKGELRAAARDHGRAVEELTAFLVPKRTWLMHDSISLAFFSEGMGFEVRFDKAKFDQEGEPYYAFYVELGTSRQRAQPSLFPAFENEREPYLARVRSIIRGATR